jgi:hypothetical protein
MCPSFGTAEGATLSALRLPAEILAGVPDDEQAEPAPDPDPGIAGGKAARVYNFDVAKLTAPA